MTKCNIAFWDVDTQHDFMDKSGALYVPGSEGIKEEINYLLQLGRAKHIPILGSVDEHLDDDPEFLIFPKHCVKGTYGQEKIFLPKVGESYFSKNTIDIFSNPEAEKAILETAKSYIVFGVAIEYCVKAVVLGMRKRDIPVFVAMDVIRGVEESSSLMASLEMVSAGATLIHNSTIKEIL